MRHSKYTEPGISFSFSFSSIAIGCRVRVFSVEKTKPNQTKPKWNSPSLQPFSNPD